MMFKSLAVAALVASCASHFMSPVSGADTVVDIIAGSANHSVLLYILNATGLVEPLLGEGPFTVFAPKDDVSVPLPDKYLEPEWHAHLTDILLYHVAAGNLTSADLAVGAEIEMLNSGFTNITSVDPPRINQANIELYDAFAGNGVVHSIDEVLLPFSAANNILTAALSMPSLFSSLVAFVTAADLVETLQSEGPFTVFAPTDDAFAALDNETVAFLTSPEGIDALIDLLLYHVTEGILLSVVAEDGLVTMANGANTTITVPIMSNANATLTSNDTDATAVSRASDEYIAINNANVIVPDILVNNGAIHIIDQVLLPPSLAQNL